MALYVPPSIRHFEPKRVVFSTWTDHMPFAYDLVAAIRPRVVAELGTHNGVSFFTFCQSIREHDIDAVAYAVDTWEGEQHAGKLDESVFNDVRGYNREHYPAIGYLMRMLFSQAADHFAADSLDLLHIDGLHTYEAVTEDFRTWYPKVRPGGIILFHDIQSRMADFGVWRFWDEIREQHDTFSFKQGYGLGVLRKPGGGEPGSQLERIMFEGTEADHEDLRAFYAHVARFAVLDNRARSGSMPPLVG